MKKTDLKPFSGVSFLLVLVILGVLAGCTSKADKEAAQQATEQAAQLATLASMPTHTPIPPTNTPIPSDTPTPTDIPTPTNTPLPSINDIIIDEKGFGQAGETVAYAFVAINPDEYNAVTDAVYRVLLYDTSNAPIQTTTITIPMHLPGQYLGITGEDVVEPGVEIIQIDVEPRTGNFTTLDPSQPIPMFQVDSVGFTDKSLNTAIGIIKNAYPADVPNVLVSALAYNQLGVLVGGGSIIVETIPANGQQYVEIPLITSEPPNGGITLYPTLSDTAFIVPNSLATDALTTTDNLQTMTDSITTTITDPDDMQKEDGNEDGNGDGNEDNDTTIRDTDSVTDTDVEVLLPTATATTATATTATATPDPDDPNIQDDDDLSLEEDAREAAEPSPTPTPTLTMSENGADDESEDITGEHTATPTVTSTFTSTSTSTSTSTLMPSPTSTLTPTLTPTPTVPRPVGRCQDNAPSTSPDGPLAWLPRSSLRVDETGVVCVWFVLDNQPVAGAEVKMNLLYLDKNIPKVVSGETATTDDLGLAEVPFRVPNTYELELELVVRHNGETYDWRNYPDELGLILYTE